MTSVTVLQQRGQLQQSCTVAALQANRQSADLWNAVMNAVKDPLCPPFFKSFQLSTNIRVKFVQSTANLNGRLFQGALKVGGDFGQPGSKLAAIRLARLFLIC